MKKKDYNLPRIPNSKLKDLPEVEKIHRLCVTIHQTMDDLQLNDLIVVGVLELLKHDLISGAYKDKCTNTED